MIPTRPAKRRTEPGRAAVTPDLQRAADLAWAGQHEQAAARHARKPWPEALALLRLSEALWCAEDAPDGLAAAEDAAARFERLGDTMWQGPALWSQACALARLGRNVERERAARRALALAQQTGDHFGLGLAHSILARGHADVAARLEGLHNALAALDAAGCTEPQLEIRLNRLNAARERRSEIAVLEERLAAGMDDHVTKPVRVEALVAALTSANGQSHG